MFQTDFVLRQIEMIASFLASVFFGKKLTTEEWDLLDLQLLCDPLGIRLLRLLEENRINEAENLLFDTIGDRPDHSLMQQGLLFYRRLAAMPEEQLAAANFSLEEVKDGLTDLARRFGISGELL